jgi:hypothetical protein
MLKLALKPCLDFPAPFLDCLQTDNADISEEDETEEDDVDIPGEMQL